MNTATVSSSPILLPPLPYEESALQPVISANTLGFHYGRHHKTYVDTLNRLIAGTEFADMPLEKIVKAAAASGRSLREVAREEGVSDEVLDEALDYRKMAKPHGS